jgi:hypothetical protein
MTRPSRSALLQIFVLVTALRVVETGASSLEEGESPAPLRQAGSMEGPSNWGELPAASDSSTAAFRNHGLPIWEAALVWPYRVVTFPLKLAGDGFGETVEFMDERRILYKINRLLTPPDLPYGFTTNLHAGGLAGLGGGLTFYHDELFSPHNRTRLGFKSSLKGSHRLTFGLRIGDGGEGEGEAGAGYRIRRNARFFGLGPQSRDEDESFFSHELSWAGVGYHRNLSPTWRASTTVILSTAGARGPRDQDEPALKEQHADRLPFGYRERSDGVSIGFEVASDDAAESGRPIRGGIRRAKASYFAGTSNPESHFWTYRGEVQQFVPLWHSYRGLALRGLLTWIDPAGSNLVPFQRLSTNDDPDQFRGYRDFRWLDRGMTLFTAEYRWPIWVVKEPKGQGIDAYLLTDIGQVFGEFDEISLDNTTVSYGGGLRILSKSGFLFRIEYATSDEESEFRFSIDQNFQFTKNDLFHGRNPIPER